MCPGAVLDHTGRCSHGKHEGVNPQYLQCVKVYTVSNKGVVVETEMASGRGDHDGGLACHIVTFDFKIPFTHSSLSDS
jgi:hypothetical protein